MASVEASTPIRVGSWFQGPTGSGQGGWTAHRLASRIAEPVTISLRAAVPLDTDLRIADRIDDGGARSWELLAPDDSIVMLARPWEPRFADTAPVSIAVAREASAGFGDLVVEHPVPFCFSCGRQHDSMRTHAAPIAGDPNGRFATDWTVPGWAVDDDGTVDEGALWAAIDCTAAWWVGYSRGRRTALTVQFAVEVTHPIGPGATYALVGWAGDHDPEWDGRKRHAASAAFAADGTCVARSVSFWVAVGDG